MFQLTGSSSSRNIPNGVLKPRSLLSTFLSNRRNKYEDGRPAGYNQQVQFYARPEQQAYRPDHGNYYEDSYVDTSYSAPYHHPHYSHHSHDYISAEESSYSPSKYTNSNKNSYNKVNQKYHESMQGDGPDAFTSHVCLAPDNRKGVCYDAIECSDRGGIPMGRCGRDKNDRPSLSAGSVCCLFEATCGQNVAERYSYFRNPGYPLTLDGLHICRSRVIKSSANVCQLKLTFNHFDIAKPVEGNCSQDVFSVSGQNENEIVPRICGYNSGQHCKHQSVLVTMSFFAIPHRLHRRRRIWPNKSSISFAWCLCSQV